MTGPPPLEARELVVTFGGVHAVDGVSLHADAGSLVGLIGPNGAGKTTTLDALTGFVPHRGRVLLAGDDVSESPPHERARRGLTRTWQSLELFDDLTVRENCALAAGEEGIGATLLDLVRPTRGRDQGATDDALDAVGLAAMAERYPGELSLGERKLVGVARALAGGPQVLLLDEPAAGLSTEESARLGEQLRHVVDRGVAMVLVDHDMGLVLSVCDRVVVLDFGRVVADGPPAQIRVDERVVAAYLGDTHAGPAEGRGG